MPPKTQPFALPLQKRDSPDKCVEHLGVPSWSKAWEPLNWAMVDPVTRLVNGVMALDGLWCFRGCGLEDAGGIT